MQIFKNNLLLIVLIFALSPCSVKETIHQQFDLDYTKTLNKTKTTINNFSNCSSTVDFATVQKEIKTKFLKDLGSFLVISDFQKVDFFSLKRLI